MDELLDRELWSQAIGGIAQNLEGHKISEQARIEVEAARHSLRRSRLVRQDLHPPRQPLWVLEPKALVKYLKNREPQLTAEEITLAGFHLSRFIRAEEARRAKVGRY